MDFISGEVCFPSRLFIICYCYHCIVDCFLRKNDSISCLNLIFIIPLILHFRILMSVCVEEGRGERRRTARPPTPAVEPARAGQALGGGGVVAFYFSKPKSYQDSTLRFFKTFPGALIGQFKLTWSVIGCKKFRVILRIPNRPEQIYQTFSASVIRC